MNFVKKIIFNMILNNMLKDKGVNSIMDKIKDVLSGKKTYLLAAASIIGIIVAWLNGSMDNVSALKALIEALFAMTLRAGVSKVGQ